MIEAEHSAQALATPNRMSEWSDGSGLGLQEPVFQALVISFAMVMSHKLRDGVAKRGLTEEDHPVQAFGFD